MAIESAAAARAVAADQREAVRLVAHQRAVAVAEARRDTRIEEAKAAAAARPSPADRAAALPARARPSGGLVLDVLA